MGKQALGPAISVPPAAAEGGGHPCPAVVVLELHLRAVDTVKSVPVKRLSWAGNLTVSPCVTTAVAAVFLPNRGVNRDAERLSSGALSATQLNAGVKSESHKTSFLDLSLYMGNIPYYFSFFSKSATGLSVETHEYV